MGRRSPATAAEGISCRWRSSTVYCNSTMATGVCAGCSEHCGPAGRRQAVRVVVDCVNDTQEIVVKPLGKQMKGLNCYAGATIMGDGHVALILDVMGITQRSGVLAEGRGSGRNEDKAASDALLESRNSMLLSRRRIDRLANPLSLVARLEEIPRDRLEHAAGRPVGAVSGNFSRWWASPIS